MDMTEKALKRLEKNIKIVYGKAYQEMRNEMSSMLSKIDLNPNMNLGEKMALMTKYGRLDTLTKQLAETALNANFEAKKYIDGEMVNVYDINYNETAKQLGFSLIDKTAIKKILTGEENPFDQISSLYDKTAIRNRMKGELMTGLLKGESIAKIADRLKNVSQKSLRDSVYMARTAVTRVQNSAKIDVGKEGERLGFTMWKRWIATEDSRVREDHAKMDGVEVPQNAPFVLPDGSKVMFPGDVSLGADPSQTINCRCTVVEFIKY